MARSTYISVNLTQKQIDFMLMLDAYELDIFSLEEIKRQAPDKFEDVNELVENLVHKKILSRIERGKYCRANFRDENVIACYLAYDGAIAYWSALNRHGLTEQFPNSVFVQSTKVKKDKRVFGVYYKFIKIAASKRQGISQEGFGNHSYKMTNIEKTIVDCFDLPQYSGGYAELIRAFNAAKLDNEQLIAACKAVHNIAVVKRMGYLAELFRDNELQSFIRFAQKQVNEKYNLFDSSGMEEGEFISKWRLRLNITRSQIIDITNNQY
jgi:predicted transcriptional regulator of viral defense system